MRMVEFANSVPQLVDDGTFDREALRAHPRERLTAALVGLYGYFGLADRVGALGVSGRPADVAAELQRVVDAGTELVVLHPLYDDAEQMERLVADVVPLVGAR
jgi:alkanesulfonate monooxygenase SsuD/methylene tetrahydromethanopterin reductase-like flavin-dependent oxidoreductase (luciferase family)